MTTPGSHHGLLVVLCGPSGVGKSTISNRLQEQYGFEYIVSATTRPRREGDDKGKKYEYISTDEFLRRLDANDFLEYAQVYDYWYATPKKGAIVAMSAGRDVLLEIDVQGALQVRFQHPEALLLFILPPDEPTLLRRLESRARESDEEIRRRFRAAKREIHMAKGSRAFDHMVINDDLDRAVREILTIINNRRAERLEAEREEQLED